MKRTLGTMLCLLAGTSLFAGNLQAVKCTKPPVIDGKLDDACWKDALKFSDFKIMNTNKEAFPATAYLLYGEDAVYAGFRLSIPEGGKVKANVLPGKGNPYNDDCVEIMIDANATATRYLQFLTNANGAIESNLADQGGFVHEPCPNTAEAAGFIGDGFWSVEIRIPFCDLDILPGKTTWGFNFCHDARTPRFQESSVAENGIFNNAAKFLQVENFKINADRYAWEFSAPKMQVGSDKGKITVDVTANIGNLATKEQEANFDLTMIGKDDNGKTVGIGGGSISKTLQGKSRASITYPRLTFKKAGNFRCILSITDPNTRELLKRKVFAQRLEFTPFLLSVKRPAYRNMIFASQGLKEVVCQLKTVLPASALEGCTVTAGIRDLQGKVFTEQVVKTHEGLVKFPVSALPDGKMQIFAKAVKGGKTMGESTVPLRKLPFKKGEVWRDENGIWHVEKKPFFLIGAWGDHLPEGGNAYTGEAPGALRIDREIVFETGFSASAILPVLSDAECAKVRKIYEKRSQIPNLFAYHTMDEPEISGCTVMALKQHAEIARDVDPYHPIIFSNDTVNGLKSFHECAEINGLHPYPPPSRTKPRNQFGRVVMFMDQAIAYGKEQGNEQTIAFLQQGFNYGDCGSANTCVPTFDEIRTQYLISLAMGGNAVMFFPHTTAQYYEFSIGDSEVAKELAALTPAMTVPDEKDPGIRCDNKNIRFRVKKVGNEYWILACSTTEEPQTGTITVPGIGNRKVYAFRENRNIEAHDGRFKDTFRNYDARVYTTDSNTYGLRTLAEVEADINQKNESRRKPGNLAFQMYEHDSMKLYASSNLNGSRTPDSLLWHVTDGIMGGKVAPHGCAHGKLAWIDKTPNQTPDWIVLEFPKPVKAGRIVVYPAEGTLKDYEVQVEQNGKFVTVGTAKELSSVWDKHQEFTFPQVTTQKVRLYVTGNNGPTTKVFEVEVYEK